MPYSHYGMQVWVCVFCLCPVVPVSVFSSIPVGFLLCWHMCCFELRGMFFGLLLMRTESNFPSVSLHHVAESVVTNKASTDIEQWLICSDTFLWTWMHTFLCVSFPFRATCFTVAWYTHCPLILDCSKSQLDWVWSMQPFLSFCIFFYNSCTTRNPVDLA